MPATIQCRCKNKSCRLMFPARPADRNRGWGKYCSKSCKAVAQADKARTKSESGVRASAMPRIRRKSKLSKYVDRLFEGSIEGYSDGENWGHPF